MWFGMHTSGGMMGGWGWLGAFFWFILLAGVVALIVWLIIRSTRTAGVRESPLDILKKRYARGEISKKEFEEMKRNLS